MNYELRKKKFRIAGWTGMVIAAVLLILQARNGFNQFDFLSHSFFAVYSITVLYFITLIATPLGKKDAKWWNLPADLYAISLVLFMMSSYSLNFNIQIFSPLAPWGKCAVGTAMLTTLALPYADRLFAPLRLILFTVAGAAALFILYLAIYLVPGYHIFLLGGLFIGLGFHGFSPLFMFIFLAKQLYRKLDSRGKRWAFAAGVVLPLVFTTVFIMQWTRFDRVVREIHVDQVLNGTSELPSWVILSQRIPVNSFTEKILGGQYLFDSFDFYTWGMDFGMNTFREKKQHDPVVSLAMLFGRNQSISMNDRVRILNAVFDARHNTYRKLWSGDDLITRDVITHAKLYPAYRLAYIEKTITIRNTSHETWMPEQEALYSFHLPEGSVATSLSLWINGVEEKSRLSTKSRADNAYVSVVGVERRDPALLHWQEGNTVTVTVFPCSPEEDRIFKIGFTVPMHHADGQLTFTNPVFTGHDQRYIRETALIRIDGDTWPDYTLAPKGFRMKEDAYRYEGKYKADWTFSLPEVPLSASTFSFMDHTYHLEELRYEQAAVDWESVYLDINAAWTDEELGALSGTDLPVYYFNGRKMTRLTDFTELPASAAGRSYSLFPFHLVDDPATALVVTRSTSLGPNLSEISTSAFAERIQSKFRSSDDRFYVFSLTELESPYLKTLNEVGLFRVATGTFSDLSAVIDRGSFPIARLGPSEVALNHAGVVIHSEFSEGATGGAAPDHILRMHHYNKIMQALGTDYFDKEHFENSLIHLANEAFVASPISSMVVLETQRDYERFGIDENENSLQNASVENSGAVPEPGEWALIILTLLALGYTLRRKLQATVSLG